MKKRIARTSETSQILFYDGYTPETCAGKCLVLVRKPLIVGIIHNCGLREKQAKEAMKVLKEVRKETEKEIKKLNKKLVKIDRWRLVLSLVKRFPAKYYIDSTPFGEVIIRCKDTGTRLYETSFIVFRG